MKKYLYFFITIFTILIGKNVFALGPNTKWLNSGNVVANVDNRIINTSQTYYNATSVRFQVDGLTNIVIGSDYRFNVNFSIINQGGSPINISQCGLNVNGAYVSTNSLNWQRNNYECGNGYCTNGFGTTTIWSPTETLGDIPIFIQCDIGNQLIRYTSYTATAQTIAQGSNNNSDIINSINNNSQNIINTNDYNANQNNANRDSNTDRIINGQHSIASEVIKNTESQKVCTWKDNSKVTFKKDETLEQNCYLDTVSGACISDSNYVTTDYIEVKPNTTYRFYASRDISGDSISSNNNYRVLGYEENKTAIQSRNTFSSGGSNTITTTANTKYIRISYKDNYFTMQGALIKCDNGNQTIFDTITDFFGNIGQTINNVYNYISTTIGQILNNIISKITELFSFFTNTDLDTTRLNALINRLKESNPPIFTILTSLKNYVQSFQVSQNNCQAINIPINTKLNNHNITIPCGTTLFWNRQDVETFKNWWNLFVGGILLYSVGFKLIKTFNNAFDPTKDEFGKELEV